MQAILGIHLLPAQGLVVLLSEDGVVQLLDGDTLEGRALPLRCAPLVMRRRFVCGLHRHRGSPLHSTMCSSVGCCVQERGGHVHSVAAGAPAPPGGGCQAEQEGNQVWLAARCVAAVDGMVLTCMPVAQPRA